MRPTSEYVRNNGDPPSDKHIIPKELLEESHERVSIASKSVWQTMILNGITRDRILTYSNYIHTHPRGQFISQRKLHTLLDIEMVIYSKPDGYLFHL